MVKKISASMILVIVLIVVSMAAALAAGLGLFGELAQDPRGDSRLTGVDKAADSIEREWTTEDGITVRIEQAYFEGDRVFISYRMSGEWNSTVLHEGAPKEGIAWDLEDANSIAARNMMSDIPERQQALLHLDGQGQRWIDCTDKGLHDGLSLSDGTYLNIIGGDNIVEADGSVIGWKECEIPEDRLDETLTFRARLYRVHSIMYQDKTTYRQFSEQGETASFEFTLAQNTDLTRLKGSGIWADHSAAAELKAGRIDLRGTVTVTCPKAWVRVWDTWENPDHIDMIEDWHLCRNGDLIAENGLQGVETSGDDRLIFEVMFGAVDDPAGLELVPVYADGQPRMEEAIVLNAE